MKKICSLKGKRCFNEVFTRGRRFRSEGFQCIVVKECGIALNGECDKRDNCSYKIGIVIGRRFGNACERNRAKRQVRAMYDVLTPCLAGNWCMAIRIFEDFKSMKFGDGLAALQNMLSRAGLIRES